MTEGERSGLSAAKRNALEEALASAKARQAEPWPERVEGAKAEVRDADQALREHTTANLAELVEEIEVAGRAVAERIDAAAAELASACAERQQVEGALGQLLVRTGPVGQGDVSYSRAESLGREARALLDAGGEEPVRVTRDRTPWSLLLAGADAVTA